MSDVHLFFDRPGFWFNLASLSLTAMGAGLGVWALWLAYVQLGNIVRVADAAKAAAESALAEVRTVTTVVELERLSGLCREVVTLIRSDHYPDASRPLHDLRIGLAKARSSSLGGQLFVPADEWTATLTEMAEITSRVRRSATSGLAVRARHSIADRVADLDQRINELSPKMIETASNKGG